MEYLFIFALAVLVSIVYSHANERRLFQSYGRLGNINSFDDGFYDSRNVVGGSDCYDLCYNAHCAGSRARISGCVCSRFDFTGIKFGGGFNQRSRSVSVNSNCNCPSGTYCVRESGRRRCVRRRSSASRVNPRNSGLPRRLGGRCGFLSPVCQASQRDTNQQVRLTYDYQLRRCVRERVFSACSVLGTRNNIFRSLRTCNRSCL